MNDNLAMPTDTRSDEEFCRSAFAAAASWRVAAIAVGVIVLWLAIYWAEALP